MGPNLDGLITAIRTDAVICVSLPRAPAFPYLQTRLLRSGARLTRPEDSLEMATTNIFVMLKRVSRVSVIFNAIFKPSAENNGIYIIYSDY